MKLGFVYKEGEKKDSDKKYRWGELRNWLEGYAHTNTGEHGVQGSCSRYGP